MTEEHEINEFEDLDDHNKSALLTKVMEWTVEWNKYGLGCVVDKDNNPISGTIGELDEDILEQLYSSPNMALAWLVPNWWAQKWWPNAVGQPHDNWGQFDRWWEEIIGWAMEPQELQRLVLDKIFDLCLATGLIEPEQVVGTLTLQAHALGYRSEEEGG